jgi:hypothetical protein
MNLTMTLSDIARQEWVAVALVSTELRRFGYDAILHNSTGFPGVKRTARGYYEARISVGGKRTVVGTRKTPEEAYELILAAKGDSGESSRLSEAFAPRRKRTALIQAAA